MSRVANKMSYWALYSLGHLLKLGVEDDSFCTFCGADEETPRHLAMNCDVISVRAKSFDRHQICLEVTPGLDTPLQKNVRAGGLKFIFLRKRKGAKIDLQVAVLKAALP